MPKKTRVNRIKAAARTILNAASGGTPFKKRRRKGRKGRRTSSFL